MNIEEVFDEHLRVVTDSRRALMPVFGRVVELVVTSVRAGGKILACGNGGSAADAQHFAAECVCRFEAERAALAAIALTTDTSALTAIGNDLGYEHVFARQIAAHARPGDILLALSTSGNSPNVLRAAAEARARHCKIIAFTGGTGGTLAALADVTLMVPSVRVARVQEVHGLCLHALAQELDDAFGRPDVQG
jgi:D-sedoheptulose 7-phosphate isomerase